MADYIYPRMYGVSNETTLMFVFPRDKISTKNSHLNFTVNEFGLNTGEIRFKMETSKIINEPKLEFK
jgi:hypothetical protein